jgi:hypothetical protein
VKFLLEGYFSVPLKTLTRETDGLSFMENLRARRGSENTPKHSAALLGSEINAIKQTNWN